MSEKRIAYLLKRFPRLSETFILHEILELRRQGVHIDIYALMDPGERVVQQEAVPLIPEVTYLRSRQGIIGWFHLLLGASIWSLRHPLRFLRVAREIALVHKFGLPSIRHSVEGLWLARDLRRRGIEHLHAHFIHSPAAAAYACRLAGGPPFSITAHAKDLYTSVPKRILQRSARAEFLVTCTAANRDYMVNEVGTAEPHVIRHGIDLTRFAATRRDDRASRRILSVGRLVEKKGFADLVTALGTLKRQGCDFHWDIYGGGPLRDELLDQCRASGIGDNVTLRGAQPQEEIAKAYANADIFALAPVVLADGDRDGIPNVLVEAMSSGLAVVSTAVSGIPELIDKGANGILVPPHDPQALAIALRHLLDDSELRAFLGRQARAKVEADFDFRAACARLRMLFGYADVAISDPAAAA